MQKHTVEFNQLAMANSEGSEAMLNRVMTKDNIGVAVLLEVRKEMIEVSCRCPFVVTRVSLLNIRQLLVTLVSPLQLENQSTAWTNS